MVDWTRACDRSGPYALTVTNKLGKRAIRAVQCNRPDGHEGNHKWTNRDCSSWCEWDRKGEPVTRSRNLIDAAV